MIGVFLRALIHSRGGKRTINAAFQFFAKFFHAPIFDEKRQARFGAQLARAMVAKNQRRYGCTARAASSGVTKTLSGEAMRKPPEPNLPPTATLKPAS